jgi:tetratricopeptide (TPR) repeat protein
MAAKINQKELSEPDRLHLFFLSANSYVEKHRSRIYQGAGLFLFLVLLSGAWYLYQLHYESSAGKIYSRLFETTMKGSGAGNEEIIRGYNDLIAAYPKSQAAVTAHYRLGNLYLNRREFDAATKAYEDFLIRAPKNSDLRTLAYNGLGTSFELAKDYQKALDYYEKASQTNAASSFEVLNFGNLGRIYEALKNSPKAAEYYSKALDKTSDPLLRLYLKRKVAHLG